MMFPIHRERSDILRYDKSHFNTKYLQSFIEKYYTSKHINKWFDTMKPFMEINHMGRDNGDNT